MEEPEQHLGHGEVSASIAAQARNAAGGSGSGESFESLKSAVQSASPDERSAAAKELSEERPAYEALHRALQELGIEPVGESAGGDE